MVQGYSQPWAHNHCGSGITIPDLPIGSCIGYPRMSASGESSTTMHRLLHASGSHPIPPPNDPKTNQYNQDLGLIHSTNGNHLESPNEGSSIDHQVTIYLYAQNITMFPTNETWVFLGVTFLATRAWLRPVSRGNRHLTVGGCRLRQSGPRPEARLLRQPALEGLTRSARTDSLRQVGRNKFRRRKATAAAFEERKGRRLFARVRVNYDYYSIGYPRMSASGESSTTMHRLLHASGSHPIPAPNDPKSTTVGKSRVAKDPIAMHTSWRSNSDIASVTSIGYPRMSASDESSTTMHRLLHASGSHPIPPPDDHKRSSKKVKSVRKKVQSRRDLNGQNIKPTLNRSHNISAQTLMDYHTGKTVKVIQVWVPKGMSLHTKNLMSLDFLTSQKRLSNQVAAVATCLTDVQKDVQDTRDTFFHQLLDFHAQAQENYNNLTTQLGELVAYINRGGNDKKGEESSSRRPQPPSDDQNRPSGGSASRGGGSSGGSSRRGDRRDSSKRRSSNGGGGSGSGGEIYGPYGPYKKNAEWWLYGKNQF
ncbi:hypothetical protein F511_32992 [Dorcoceras hygrometricum]|uniref:Uncharacterized protein n=1 Tax=Dorcoceras hygrometricum TaxID=472368 RepID=A0A2Z7B7B4_9LAMI|nr:hypothetical protein F511_32992 [Dorcoceras hygrometricum]